MNPAILESTIKILGPDSKGRFSADVSLQTRCESGYQIHCMEFSMANGTLPEAIEALAQQIKNVCQP